MRTTNVAQLPDLSKSFDRLQELMGDDETNQLRAEVISSIQEYINLTKKTEEYGEMPEFLLYFFSLDEFEENLATYREAAKVLNRALANLELATQVKMVMNNDFLFSVLPLMLTRLAKLCENIDRANLRAELDLYRITQWGHRFKDEYPGLLKKYIPRRDHALPAVNANDTLTQNSEG